jgi:hypothetical protein
MLPFIIFTHSFLLLLGASKGGSGPGLSGPLRGPASTYIVFKIHILFWSEISFSLLISVFLLMIEVDLGMTVKTSRCSADIISL